MFDFNCLIDFVAEGDAEFIQFSSIFRFDFNTDLLGFNNGKEAAAK